MSPPEFASAVMAYCYATRASVTSWGRTEHRNQLVGGHPKSYHLHWLAADVAYDELPNEALRRAVAKRLGIKLVIEGDHDHLQAI